MKPQKTTFSRLAEVGESAEKSGKARPARKLGESCALGAKGREASRRKHCHMLLRGRLEGD